LIGDGNNRVQLVRNQQDAAKLGETKADPLDLSKVNGQFALSGCFSFGSIEAGFGCVTRWWQAEPKLSS
jgi:hypothetical protein